MTENYKTLNFNEKVLDKESEVLMKIDSFVDGWLDFCEGKTLYLLAKECPPELSIVEIGSWRGRSTAFLGSGAAAGKKAHVFAIDHFEGSPEHRQDQKKDIFGFFRKNMMSLGLTEYVTPIVSSSENAAKSFDKPIGLLFIDGSHEYEEVKKDFLNWFPKVVTDGVIALHDATDNPEGYEGPMKVRREYFTDKNFKDVKQVFTTVYGRKIGGELT